MLMSMLMSLCLSVFLLFLIGGRLSEFLVMFRRMRKGSLYFLVSGTI